MSQLNAETELVLSAATKLNVTGISKLTLSQIHDKCETAKLLRNKLIREHSNVTKKINELLLEQNEEIEVNDEHDVIAYNHDESPGKFDIEQQELHVISKFADCKFSRNLFLLVSELKITENIILPVLLRYGEQYRDTLLQQYLKLLATLLLPIPLFSTDEVKQKDWLLKLKIRCGVDEFFLLLTSVIAPIFNKFAQNTVTHEDHVILETCLIVTARLFNKIEKESICIIDALCRTRYVNVLLLLLQQNYSTYYQSLNYNKIEQEQLPSSLNAHFHTNMETKEKENFLNESSIREHLRNDTELLIINRNTERAYGNNLENLGDVLLKESDSTTAFIAKSKATVDKLALLSKWNIYLCEIIFNIFSFTNPHDMAKIYYNNVIKFGNTSQKLSVTNINTEEDKIRASNERDEQIAEAKSYSDEESKLESNQEQSNYFQSLEEAKKEKCIRGPSSLLKQYVKEKEKWRYVARSKHGALASNGLLIKQIARHNNDKNNNNNNSNSSSNNNINNMSLIYSDNMQMSNAKSDKTVRTISSVYGTKRKDPLEILRENDRRKRSRYKYAEETANKQSCSLLYTTKIELASQLFTFLLHGFEPLTIMCWQHFMETIKTAEQAVTEYREITAANNKTLETTEIKCPFDEITLNNLETITHYLEIGTYVLLFTREFTHYYLQFDEENKAKYKDHWILLFRSVLSCVTLQHIESGFSLLRIYLYYKPLERRISVTAVIAFLAEILTFMMTIKNSWSKELPDVTIATNALISSILQHEDYLKLIFEILNAFTTKAVANDRACKCVLLLAAIFDSMTKFSINETLYFSSNNSIDSQKCSREMEKMNEENFVEVNGNVENNMLSMNEIESSAAECEIENEYVKEEEHLKKSVEENIDDNTMLNNDKACEITEEEIHDFSKERIDLTEEQVIPHIRKEEKQKRVFYERSTSPSSKSVDDTFAMSHEPWKRESFIDNIVNITETAETISATNCESYNEELSFQHRKPINEEIYDCESNHDDQSVISGRSVNVNVYIRRLATPRHLRIIHSVLST